MGCSPWDHRVGHTAQYTVNCFLVFTVVKMEIVDGMRVIISPSTVNVGLVVPRLFMAIIELVWLQG